MSNNDRARELLAYSYFISAIRVTEAIEGRLNIRNSRSQSPPPSGSGEIIGLCGQGGGHPYFRIQVDVLNAALTLILSIRDFSLPIDLVMEEIANACQELRQKTYFDTGTDCVNDELPSMVPLLPPEEIWLDQRELPLDVWRLLVLILTWCHLQFHPQYRRTILLLGP
jgi:hypothetical protein